MNRIVPILFSLLCFGVLCTTFQTSPSMTHALTAVQSQWAWWSVAAFGVGVLWQMRRRSLQFALSTLDLMGILFLIVTLFTYQYDLNPAPYRLAFCGLLGCWWFLLRISTEQSAPFRRIIPLLLVTVAGVEAFWGVAQLYGGSSSFHSLFTLTGSFYNPGPYSCYLAVLLPLALHTGLTRSEATSLGHRILFWGAMAVVSATVIVLPAGESRTAWVAALAGSVYVAGAYWK